MTNEQILKKAIEKAIKNNPNIFYWIEYWEDYTKDIIGKEYYVLIFSHDFAKAFWGKEPAEHYWYGNSCGTCGEDINAIKPTSCIAAWRDHLQQMVLETQPLKYLGRFL